MVRYWCVCQKCGGKPVGKATWYRHKKQRTHRNLGVAAISAGDGRGPGTLLNPPSDIYVKEFPRQDIEFEDKIKRSDTVGVVH